MSYPSTRKEKEVWQVCDELVSLGTPVREITGKAIATHLKKLGYKAGSNTQRYQYRETWLNKRNLALQKAEQASYINLSHPASPHTTENLDALLKMLQIQQELLQSIMASQQRWPQELQKLYEVTVKKEDLAQWENTVKEQMHDFDNVLGTMTRLLLSATTVQEPSTNNESAFC